MAVHQNKNQVNRHARNCQNKQYLCLEYGYVWVDPEKDGAREYYNNIF